MPGVLNSFCQVAGSGSNPVQIHYKKGTFLPVLWIIIMLDPLLNPKPMDVNNALNKHTLIERRKKKWMGLPTKNLKNTTWAT